MNGRTRASENCKQVSVCESEHRPAVQCMISRATSCRCANYSTRPVPTHVPIIAYNTVYWLCKRNIRRRGSLAAAPHSKKDSMACMVVSKIHANSLYIYRLRGCSVDNQSCNLQVYAYANYVRHTSLHIPYGRKFWREDILADC